MEAGVFEYTPALFYHRLFSFFGIYYQYYYYYFLIIIGTKIF